MGGFTETTPPPAPDVPPENAFDVQLFTASVAKELRAAGAPAFSDAALSAAWDLGFAHYIAFILKLLGHDAGWLIGILLKAVMPILEGLVAGATEVLEPGMQALGLLTNAYVRQMTGRGQTTTPAGLPIPGGSQQDATSTVFDQIMAPLLNLLTPSNPDTAGAGDNNARHILGTIISLHLSTWAVNIISNVTGLGYLKWINSFDDALTSGISARGFSRLASKPYLEKYVVTPLARDLNRQWPVNIPGTSALVKGYIRGALSRAEFVDKMRRLGYAEEVIEDLLLEAVKMLSIGDVVLLVNDGQWTEDQALTHLRQQGWPGQLAPAAFWLERNSRVRTQMYSLASSLTDAFVDRRLDNPTLRALLKSAGLPPDEIEAYSTRGAILQELSRRLSLSQVKSLFAEDLVDLDYVLNFLRDEGYGADEVDLLALLEFTRKEDRAQRKAVLLDRRRVALEAQLGFEAEADRARLEELAALGGPTA